MKIITDDRGRTVSADTEPAPASVALVGGAHGNAYQLYASDGLWHRAREARTWEDMLTERNLVLVYDAPVREKRPEPEQVDYCVVHQVVHYDGHESGSCKITKKWTGLPAGAQRSLS